MKATLLTQFHAVQALARMNLEGLSEEQSLARPAPGGNGMRWLVGHLTWTYHGILPVLGQEPFLDETDFEVFKRGAGPLANGGGPPPWDELVGHWKEVQKRFLAGFEAFEEARAREKAPYSPGGNEDETLGSLLALIAFHQSYHVGQLGLARRLVGEDGALK